MEPIGDANRANLYENGGQGDSEGLHDMVRNCGEPVLLLDPEAGVADANLAAASLLGFPDPEGLRGFSIQTLASLEQPDAARAGESLTSMIRQALERGWGRFEWTACNAAGREFAAEVSLTRSVIGGRPHLVCQMRDITGEKHLAQRAREGEELMDAIAESIRDAIVVLDPLGVVAFWNRSAEKMLGWLAGEAVGQPLQEIFPSLKPWICPPGDLTAQGDDSSVNEASRSLKNSGTRYLGNV